MFLKGGALPGHGRTLQATLGLHGRTRCPGRGGMGPQGPHLLPLLFHDGLVLEVGQLGQPGGFLGLGPACAHLFLQFLVAEAGLLKAIGPRSYVGLSQNGVRAGPGAPASPSAEQVLAMLSP